MQSLRAELGSVPEIRRSLGLGATGVMEVNVCIYHRVQPPDVPAPLRLLYRHFYLAMPLGKLLFSDRGGEIHFL